MDQFQVLVTTIGLQSNPVKISAQYQNSGARNQGNNNTYRGPTSKTSHYQQSVKSIKGSNDAYAKTLSISSAQEYWGRDSAGYYSQLRKANLPKVYTDDHHSKLRKANLPKVYNDTMYANLNTAASESKSNLNYSQYQAENTQGNFDSNTHVNIMTNMKNQSQISQMGKAQEQGSNVVSFQINHYGGTNAQINDKFQENYFQSASPISSQKPRGGRSRLMALPKGAEGSWGDADMDASSSYYENLEFERNYVIAGVWTSEKWSELEHEFPRDILNDYAFDDSNIDLKVVSTDKHMPLLMDQVRDKVDITVLDDSIYDQNQLKDAGINWMMTGQGIWGRTLFKDSDYEKGLKTKVALDNGMNVMVCIDDFKVDRYFGNSQKAIARQLQATVDQVSESQWENIVLVYQPVWAKDKVASPLDAQNTHKYIRNWLSKAVSPQVANATRIIYGGNVFSQSEHFISQDDIDGFLLSALSFKTELGQVLEAAQEHKKNMMRV